MVTYLLLFFSFFWGNLTQQNTFAIQNQQMSVATHRLVSPKSEGINRVAIIKKALAKTWENMRRRISWWSDLLTITAIMWGLGVLLKIGAWLLGLSSWADYAATLLFVGGGVFFLIWFFQMSASLN